MRTPSLIAGACVCLLLISKLGATQLAPIYAAAAALPFAKRFPCKLDMRWQPLPVAVATATTVAVTWQPFDFAAASTAVLIVGACFSAPGAAK